MTTERNPIVSPALRCRKWARAVINLGRKILNTPALADGDMQFANEHFFLISIMKLYDWCDVLQAVEPRFANASKIVFDVVTPDVKNVRDMREHDDEYLQGGGRRKKEFIFTAGAAISIDATSTFVTDSGYFIGGRVNVAVLVDAASRFLPMLFDELDAVGLPWIRETRVPHF
ncbi:hypothetical protein [Paraburkholderia caballeronis]|uniref:hypothetical protein n=1 Tax=Paraburkholderia caballeronis TaxID=416943 RepID=UPI001065160D|nr:hypothetical protein [Paraburkholderia caballeronis]